jgi:hypothetical protein
MRSPVLAGLAALGALGAGGPAAAAVTGQGLASLTIEPAAGISVTSSLSLPTVTMTGLTTVNVSPSGSTQGLGLTTVKVASGPIGNAALTVTGQAGDAVSMAVPESFRVIRTGGTETLTVKTNTNMEYALGPGGVAVGGALSADTMSVHVGGALNLASADAPAPGAYQGFLLVVVQYN